MLPPISATCPITSSWNKQLKMQWTWFEKNWTWPAFQLGCFFLTQMPPMLNIVTMLRTLVETQTLRWGFKNTLALMATNFSSYSIFLVKLKGSWMFLRSKYHGISHICICCIMYHMYHLSIRMSRSSVLFRGILAKPRQANYCSFSSLAFSGRVFFPREPHEEKMFWVMPTNMMEKTSPTTLHHRILRLSFNTASCI